MEAMFGHRKGAEEWKEELITECPERFDSAREWAEANGFDKIRTVTINENAPIWDAQSLVVRK